MERKKGKENTENGKRKREKGKRKGKRSCSLGANFGYPKINHRIKTLSVGFRAVSQLKKEDLNGNGRIGRSFFILIYAKKTLNCRRSYFKNFLNAQVNSLVPTFFSHFYWGTGENIREFEILLQVSSHHQVFEVNNKIFGCVEFLLKSLYVKFKVITTIFLSLLSLRLLENCAKFAFFSQQKITFVFVQLLKHRNTILPSDSTLSKYFLMLHYHTLHKAHPYRICTE